MSKLTFSTSLHGQQLKNWNGQENENRFHLTDFKQSDWCYILRHESAVTVSCIVILSWYIYFQRAYQYVVVSKSSVIGCKYLIGIALLRSMFTSSLQNSRAPLSLYWLDDDKEPLANLRNHYCIYIGGVKRIKGCWPFKPRFLKFGGKQLVLCFCLQP